MKKLVLGMAVALASAQARAAETQGYLWIDWVFCTGDGFGNTSLQVQAQYFDSKRQPLGFPIFAQYSPDERSPWAFSIDPVLCDRMRPEIEAFKGRLLPRVFHSETSAGSHTVTYPCGPMNHMSGDRGTCGKTVGDLRTYVQYRLNKYLFSSWAQ